MEVSGMVTGARSPADRGTNASVEAVITSLAGCGPAADELMCCSSKAALPLRWIDSRAAASVLPALLPAAWPASIDRRFWLRFKEGWLAEGSAPVELPCRSTLRAWLVRLPAAAV